MKSVSSTLPGDKGVLQYQRLSFRLRDNKINLQGIREKKNTDREKNPRKRRKELEEGEEAISERVKKGAEETLYTQP